MSYKVAIVVNCFDPDAVSSRGAGVYLQSFILSITKNCSVDLYCEKTPYDSYPSIDKIIKLELGQVLDEEFFSGKGYDFVFQHYQHCEYSSVELRHAHSLMYRENVVRTPFELFIKNIFDRKRLIDEKYKQNYKEEINKPEIVFANSIVAREDYINFGGADPDRVFVLTPCISTKKDFHFQKQPVFTFGMSAVTFALKGGYVFLNALWKLKKSKKDFLAKIIYPNYSKNYILKAYVALLGLQKNIEFFGFQNDMTDFYSSIDCLVVPSREETFGMVVLEAMAAGKPVLVSSRCGAADIVKENQNGWIFEYEKNPDKNLFEKLKKIMEEQSSLDEVSKNAYSTAQKYSLEYHSSKMIEVFDKVSNSK